METRAMESPFLFPFLHFLCVMESAAALSLMCIGLADTALQLTAWQRGSGSPAPLVTHRTLWHVALVSNVSPAETSQYIRLAIHHQVFGAKTALPLGGKQLHDLKNLKKDSFHLVDMNYE